MWVNIDLKAPDEGSWIALTRVHENGDFLPMGYVESGEFKKALDTLAELNRMYEALNEIAL